MTKVKEEYDQHHSATNDIGTEKTRDGSTTVAETETAKRPHILFILADDMGTVPTACVLRVAHDPLSSMCTYPCIHSTSRQTVLYCILRCLTHFVSGWNDVSWNTASDIDTPNLSRLARRGIIFNRTYAQASCSP